MSNKRISYNWLKDMIYTGIWSFIITTIFVVIMEIIIHNDNQFVKPILAINFVIVPFAILFIGLRPILGLRIIPDTLFIKKNKITLENGEIILIENITSIEVHQIGAVQSHLLYYEMILKEIPKSIKIRKRKSLVIVEPYNIKYLFDTRVDFLQHIIDLGFPEEKINWKEVKTKHIFGFREKFKK